MKANIYFNSKSKGLDYSGEGTYVLVLEETDKPVSFHLCSDRAWAEHDFVTMHQEELEKNNVTSIYSLGKLVWRVTKRN